jgi:hypothetical protein
MARSFLFSVFYSTLPDPPNTPSLKCPVSGVTPVISEALGHSSVAFTMDTYSHIIEGMQEDAAALLDGVLPKAKNGCLRKNNAKLAPLLDIELNEG